MIAVLTWIILFLPLVAAVGITLFTLRHRRLSAGLSIGAVCGALLASVTVWLGAGDGPVEIAWTWLLVGGLEVELGLLLDPLSLTMLLVVTGVGSLIHIYSYGYMEHDPDMPRYFAGLSFFTFSMLGIVLSNNLIQLFIFWELVGLSSYLLIGFWYERASAADAGKKAFVVNRLGDFGFFLGILTVWGLAGSIRITELREIFDANPEILGASATAAGLLIFCGAVGKSAQFPLHVWLPDAMEGPTPVSALIHAATMVAAGVYMLSRMFFLFDATALMAIAWIGGITALLAAVIAIQQNDIKRILAYSTLSQLGYMTMAVGLHDPNAGMFHLVTHASFKALLFLGAGSVIVALHHEQNIWRMGGLAAKMPKTFWTFLLGTLALCGVPPLSGYFSKEGILLAARQENIFLFGLGSVVVALTAFYMFRLLVVVFLGPAKGEGVKTAHEAPPVMTWPQIILAVPTVIAAFLGIDRYLGHVLPATHEAHALPWHALGAFSDSPVVAFFSLGALVLGIVSAYAVYRPALRDPLPEHLGAFSQAMQQRFYLDEVYEALVAATHEMLSRIADWIDRWLIAGLAVRGSYGVTDIFGRALRLVHTGHLQTYAFLLTIGVVIVLWLMLRS